MPRVIVETPRLLKSLSSDTLLDGEIELDELAIGGQRFEIKIPVSYDVVVTNTGAGLVATGTVTGTFLSECSRCLEAFEAQVVGNVEGFYITEEHAESIPEEQEYEIIEGDQIDLWPALQAALAIELPYVPLCRDECKGLCPGCGINLNLETCSCEPEEPESPFAVLKDKFKQDEQG